MTRLSKRRKSKGRKPTEDKDPISPSPKAVSPAEAEGADSGDESDKGSEGDSVAHEVTYDSGYEEESEADDKGAEDEEPLQVPRKKPQASIVMSDIMRAMTEAPKMNSKKRAHLMEQLEYVSAELAELTKHKTDDPESKVTEAANPEPEITPSGWGSKTKPRVGQAGATRTTESAPSPPANWSSAEVSAFLQKFDNWANINWEKLDHEKDAEPLTYPSQLLSEPNRATLNSLFSIDPEMESVKGNHEYYLSKGLLGLAHPSILDPEAIARKVIQDAPFPGYGQEIGIQKAGWFTAFATAARSHGYAEQFPIAFTEAADRQCREPDGFKPTAVQSAAVKLLLDQLDDDRSGTMVQVFREQFLEKHKRERDYPGGKGLLKDPRHGDLANMTTVTFFYVVQTDFLTTLARIMPRFIKQGGPRVRGNSGGGGGGRAESRAKPNDKPEVHRQKRSRDKGDRHGKKARREKPKPMQRQEPKSGTEGAVESKHDPGANDFKCAYRKCTYKKIHSLERCYALKNNEPYTKREKILEKYGKGDQSKGTCDGLEPGHCRGVSVESESIETETVERTDTKHPTQKQEVWPCTLHGDSQHSIQTTYVVDTGTLRTYIGRGQVQRLVDLSSSAIKFVSVPAMRVRYASTNAGSICKEQITLRTTFQTINGAYTIPVTMYILEDDVPDLLVGRDVLQSLGFDADQLFQAKLEALAKRHPALAKVSKLQSTYTEEAARQLDSMPFTVSNKSAYVMAQKRYAHVVQKAKQQFVSRIHDSQATSSLPVEARAWASEASLDVTDPAPEVEVGDGEEGSLQSAIRDMTERAMTCLQGKKHRLHRKRLRNIIESVNCFRTEFCVTDTPAKVTPLRVLPKPDAKPVLQKVRKYNDLEKKFLDEYVTILLENGLIEPASDSKWASQAIPIPKGTLSERADKAVRDMFRLCVNYRAVNAQMQTHTVTMPDLEHEIQSLKGMNFFGSIDLFRGYWQCPLAPESQEYYSFTCPRGTYRPTRIPQGCSSSVASFQSAMTEVLDVHRNIVKIWLDDVLIHAKTVDEYLDNLELVLNALDGANFKVSAKKTILIATSVKWCGKIISPSGVANDPERVAAIQAAPVPTNAAELNSFVAGLSWMRDSLPEYARISDPLLRLVDVAAKACKAAHKTNKKLARVMLHKPMPHLGIQEPLWTNDHDESFRACKDLVRENLTLAFADPNKIACLFCDASDLYYGAFLTQIPREDVDLPVEEQRHEVLRCMSGSFKRAALSRCILEKEAFAIIQSVCKFRHLLVRRDPFVMYTDNKALSYLWKEGAKSAKHTPTSMKLQRWLSMLLDYQFIIRYIPGDQNIWADMFTRWAATPADATTGAEPSDGRDGDTEDGDLATPGTSIPRVVSSLCRTVLRRIARVEKRARIVPCFHVGNPDEVWPTKAQLKQAQLEAPPSARCCGSLRLGKPDDRHDYIHDEQGRMYVPDVNGLRERIAVAAHCGSRGHMGSKVTADRVATRFTWPKMKEQIKEFIFSCLHCKDKHGHSRPRPFAHQLHATTRNKVLHLDFLYMSRHLSAEESRRLGGKMKYLLLLKDDFSGYCTLTMCESPTAEVVVKALLEWPGGGSQHHTWVTDGGSHFTASVLHKYKKAYHVHHHVCTAYSPWANGTVERLCRTVLKMFRALLSESRLTEKDWTQLVGQVQTAINNAPLSRKHKLAPCYLQSLVKPVDPFQYLFSRGPGDDEPDPDISTEPASAADIKKALKEVQEALDQVHKLTADDVKERTKPRTYSKYLYEVKFDVGDFVLMARKPSSKNSKLALTWQGPFQIIELVNKRVFRVRDIVNKDTFVAHAQRLMFYSDSSLNTSTDLKDHVAHHFSSYEVEKLEAHRYNEELMQHELKVRWLGFDEPTWEPMSTIEEDQPAMVKEYLNSLSKKDREKLTQSSVPPQGSSPVEASEKRSSRKRTRSAKAKQSMPKRGRK